MNEVNKHSHTKACRKYDRECRFAFPKYPSYETIIAKPLNEKDEIVRREKLKKYDDTLRKVGDILNDEGLISNLIKSIGFSEKESEETYRINKRKRIDAILHKADVIVTDYIDALSYTRKGYKIVLSRDVTEILINNFNIEWTRAWNGNTDIQPCLSFHEVITYIHDYIGKDDTGVGEVINAVVKESTSEGIKEIMKEVANTFLTHRQIGEAEAVYKLLPNMLLKNSNVACQWLAVGKRSEMSKRWKLASQDMIEKNMQGLIKIQGRDGLWFEQADMLQKYLRRPTKLESISASQFAKVYTTSSARLQSSDTMESDDQDEEEMDEESRKYDILDIIIGEDDLKIPLPHMVQIQDPYPGESSIMRKRRKPAVLRYHKVSRIKDYERWMLRELMLFTSFRNKDLDEYENNTITAYEQKKHLIGMVKSKVMEHLESVEEARWMEEEARKEYDLEEIGIHLDSNFEQSQMDCCQEGQIMHPDYAHLDTDITETSSKNQTTNIFKNITIPSLDELKEKTRCLDQFQKEVVNIAMRYAKDLVKARREGNLSPKPVYLIGHGGAGAGKSTVIDVVSKWCHLILSKEGDDSSCPYIIKTAFTGTAASNIQGQTLHTAFGFNFDNKHYSLSDKTRDEKRVLFRNLKIVIIDEVSMVKSDMLYQLDLKLQELKELEGVPFGGVSILAFGDLLQLRPVLGSFPFERPLNKEFHATYYMHNRWEMFKVINLEINHRQGKDKAYADTLNRIRVGKMTNEDSNSLKDRVRSKNHPDLKDCTLYIVPTRKACAHYNKEYLKSLEGEEILLQARHSNATQKEFKPFIDKKEGAIGTTAFIDSLTLKIGAKIILIHNIDTVDGLTNGQLGTVIDVLKDKNGKVDKLIVNLVNKEAGTENRKKFPSLAKKYPDSVIIEKVTVSYSLRKKGGVAGSNVMLNQFPVKLAHAITAHKIQGQTLPKPMKVAFDLKSVFEEAQGYVMLSRVQELNQVFIIEEFDASKLYPSKKALKELDRMNKISFNENPPKWESEKSSQLKLLSLNCLGLQAHYKDLMVDHKINQADIIHLGKFLVEFFCEDQPRLKYTFVLMY